MLKVKCVLFVLKKNSKFMSQVNMVECIENKDVACFLHISYNFKSVKFVWEWTRISQDYRSI